MNITDALNKTADHIEQNPTLYDFNQGMVLGERDGNYPACMLARLGQVVGMARGLQCTHVAHAVLGMTAGEVYAAVLERAGHPGYNAALYVAPVVAVGLRKLAHKYEGIPLDVRKLFDPRVEFEPRYPEVVPLV